jgi:hypothetical protein
MLTSADKAWMDAANIDVFTDFGSTYSVRRLIRDGTTGQMAPTTAHLTGIRGYVSQSRMVDAMFAGAPVGEYYTGVLNHLNVPTQIQKGDILTDEVAGTTYQISEINDAAPLLNLLLQHYVPALNTTP